jgi:hypothetical protein
MATTSSQGGCTITLENDMEDNRTTSTIDKATEENKDPSDEETDSEGTNEPSEMTSDSEDTNEPSEMASDSEDTDEPSEMTSNSEDTDEPSDMKEAGEDVPKKDNNLYSSSQKAPMDLQELGTMPNCTMINQATPMDPLELEAKPEDISNHWRPLTNPPASGIEPGDPLDGQKCLSNLLKGDTKARTFQIVRKHAKTLGTIQRTTPLKKNN